MAAKRLFRQVSVEDQQIGQVSPFDWDIFGANLTYLASETLIFLLAAILLDYLTSYKQQRSLTTFSWFGRRKQAFRPLSTLQSDVKKSIDESKS